MRVTRQAMGAGSWVQADTGCRQLGVGSYWVHLLVQAARNAAGRHCFGDKRQLTPRHTTPHQSINTSSCNHQLFCRGSCLCKNQGRNPRRRRRRWRRLPTRASSSARGPAACYLSKQLIDTMCVFLFVFYHVTQLPGRKCAGTLANHTRAGPRWCL